MNYMNNAKYDRLNYKNTICSVDNYVNEKLDSIHKQLFDDALNDWFNDSKNELGYEDLDSFLSDYTMYEEKSMKYYEPSKITMMQKKLPHTIYKIDLADWWNDTQYDIIIDRSIEEKLIDEEAKKYLEITYIDYINDKMKLVDKMTGDEYWIDSKYVTEDIKLADEFSLKNTFGELLKKYHE